MKLLLDENLPQRLRKLLIGHDAFTVAYMKWAGIGNGELLALAPENGFNAVVTKDLGIEYQQSRMDLPCALVVLHSATNSLRDIEPLVPNLLKVLETLVPRTVSHVR